jgi:hypothetical protein
MRRALLFIVLAAIAAVVVAGWRLAWDLDWRWRPHTITKGQDAIARALEQSGWVSPHLTGPKLYVVVYRACGACAAFEQAAFGKLQAGEVDTRVIAIARADVNGQAQSTPAERATVAELWTNRSWKLFQQWSLTAPGAWTAPGIPAADGDAGRSAVIEAGRQLAGALKPDLAANGVGFDYPMLVWWTRDGRMRACACTDPRSYRFVEQELAAPAR